jgi:pyruvate-ferredoxin/flavodoxin oxidoreductase
MLHDEHALTCSCHLLPPCSRRLVTSGRYGLASKDFTPSMAVAVFADLAAAKPRKRFTVGIVDDVTHLSIPYGPELNTLPKGTFQCMFWGMGSDGTVGANKEAVKIIADNTPLFAQVG